MKAAAAFLCVSIAMAPAIAIAQPPPQDAQSSAEIAEHARATDWTYNNPIASVAKYKTFIVEPTVVSTDPAAKWGKLSDADKQKYADFFTNALKAEIGKSYGLATAKGPDVGVLRLTLLGVSPGSPVAIATRVTPMGLALNGVQSLRGKPGSFSGSAEIGFELMDSQSRDLVVAAVRRRSPNALDIGATTSTESTVASIAKDAAAAVRAGLDKANGR